MAEPESFHFTIVGDGYEFSESKPSMYVRQEATKEMWQLLGSDITFNNNYRQVLSKGLVKPLKSTIFPLYYERIDTSNDIYDIYAQMVGNYRDYRNLSGSEITWDKYLDEFNVTTHIACSPMEGHWKAVTKEVYEQAVENKQKRKKDTRGETTFYYVWDNVGRLRGNAYYQEDRWHIQIPSITLM